MTFSVTHYGQKAEAYIVVFRQELAVEKARLLRLKMKSKCVDEQRLSVEA